MKHLFAGAAVILLCATAARADLLLHRQGPGRTGGYAADTQFMSEFGGAAGQVVADKFNLQQDLPICRVTWWSFYGSSLAQEVEPPPLSEIVRIRFLGDAVGLPGALLWEEQFLNPLRQATGFSIATGPGPPEFRYQVDLVNCFAPPQPGAPYWIEIAQLGDPSSYFRWEGSNTGGEFAVRFPIDTPFRLISGIGQLAYELRTPEPCSGAMLALVAGYLLWRGKR